MTVGPFRAIILGAPGSGKGTVCGRISKHFKMHHISSGDILRNNVERETELGVIAKQYINNGKLVPDVHIIKCILNELEICKDSPWLLDGFPRTREQAEKLWDTIKFDTVLNLDVPFEVIIGRIQGRWIHLASGRTYNTEFNAPKVPFKDDITGEPLIQRPDDNPVAVRERLQIYESITKPVIDFYKSKGILHTFSGKTTDEIWPKVNQFLQTSTAKL